jgi:hypothetical protein
VSFDAEDDDCLNRTIQIHVGRHTFLAEDLLPPDLRDALDLIKWPRQVCTKLIEVRSTARVRPARAGLRTRRPPSPRRQYDWRKWADAS